MAGEQVWSKGLSGPTDVTVMDGPRKNSILSTLYNRAVPLALPPLSLVRSAIHVVVVAVLRKTYAVRGDTEFAFFPRPSLALISTPSQVAYFNGLLFLEK